MFKFNSIIMFNINLQRYLGGKQGLFAFRFFLCIPGNMGVAIGIGLHDNSSIHFIDDHVSRNETSS